MAHQRRRFTRDFKLRILMQLQAGKTVAQLAREYEVSPNQIYQWQKRQAEYGELAFAGNGNVYTMEGKLAEMERKIGQQTMEIDWLRKANTTLQDTLTSQKKTGGRQ